MTAAGVPFKFKSLFKDVFGILAAKDGKLPDMKEFHGYMKAPFNSDIMDTYGAIKNMTQDTFFVFLAEAQKDSAISYDDILWTFVERFLKHQVFDGKDMAPMKPLRTFYDPLFKSLRQDPDALWAKYCGSSATNATVSGLVSLVKDLQAKGTAQLPDLLKCALPKNKPLKPAPVMRAASPKRVSSSTPPPAKLPVSPSAAAAAAAAEKKPATPAPGLKQSPTPSSPSTKALAAAAASPAASPTSAALAPPKQQQQPDESKKDDVVSEAAAQSEADTPTNELDDSGPLIVAGTDSAPPAVAVAAGGTSGAVAAEQQKQVVAPAAAESARKEQQQQQQQQQQVPPAAAAALANANLPPPLQPTALGAAINKLNAANSSLPSAASSSNRTQQPATATIVPRLPGSSYSSQQQQQQQPLLGIAQSAPLGLAPATPNIVVPPHVASAVAEIDSRHEKLRAQIEEQASTLLSVDGLLSVIAQRMQQLHPPPLPQQQLLQRQNGNGASAARIKATAATERFRQELESLRGQMGTFCASVGAELDGFRRHTPQYVADLGRGVASGKALQHPPNDEFSELRLNALLAAVRKDHDEALVKERAAQRLEMINEQEMALKREIAALEGRFWSNGGGDLLQQQQQQQQQQQAGAMMNPFFAQMQQQQNTRALPSASHPLVASASSITAATQQQQQQQLGVASVLQQQQQKQLLAAARLQQKTAAQMATPPAAVGTLVHSPEVVAKKQAAAAALGQSPVASPALSIAQRIAARVERGHGTANHVMPASSATLHAAYRAY